MSNYVIKEKKRQNIQFLKLINSIYSTCKFTNNFINYYIQENNEYNISIYKLDNYIGELIYDYARLLKILREQCKEDIVVIGYYSSDYNYEKYINYFNKKLNEISKENNIIFIDTNEMYENKNLSYEKEEIDVATEIIKVIEDVLLK